jgi:hypothetical protein
MYTKNITLHTCAEFEAKPFWVLLMCFLRFVSPVRARFFVSAILAVLWILSSANLQAQIASFPGAVGYGAATTGGWSLTGTNHTGGTVYHVTNLNDSGAGSFRSGVATSGNIVVFDVGGSIQSLSPVSVAGNVSIEGQTAPGGIQIFGAETSFYGSSNVICRYVHSRERGAKQVGASAED